MQTLSMPVVLIYRATHYATIIWTSDPNDSVIQCLHDELYTSTGIRCPNNGVLSSVCGLQGCTEVHIDD